MPVTLPHPVVKYKGARFYVVKAFICVQCKAKIVVLDVSQTFSISFCLCLRVVLLLIELMWFLQLAVSIFGVLASPQLGIFTLGMLVPRATSKVRIFQ